MAKIPGRLISGFVSMSMVRISVSCQHREAETKSPFTAEDLDAAEDILTMCGLMPGEAAVLRRTLKRNNVAIVWIRALTKRLRQSFGIQRP